jgi:hypothetical protein
MDAQPLAAVRGSPVHRDKLIDQLTRATWLAALGILLMLCVFLALRRCAVQQTDRWAPLPGTSLIAVGAAAAVVVSILRLVGRHVQRTGRAQLVFWGRLLLPSLGVLLLAGSLSLPQSVRDSPVALSLLWGILIGEEVVWWYVELSRGRRRQGATGVRSATPPRSEGRETSDAGPDAGGTPGVLPDDRDATLRPHVTQQVIRSHAPDGGETISGFLRGDFRPGERSQNLHLQFCPPLDAKPTLTAQQVEGPTATVKTAQVESYGARLELRLAAKASRAVSVVVKFDARLPASPASTDAAKHEG